MKNKTPDIRIEFAAIPNSNANKGGFVPVISVTTPSTTDPLIDPYATKWSPVGYDKDVALELAKTMADNEAAQWIGDYTTSVTKAPLAARDAKARADFEATERRRETDLPADLVRELDGTDSKYHWEG